MRTMDRSGVGVGVGAWLGRRGPALAASVTVYMS